MNEERLQADLSSSAVHHYQRIAIENRHINCYTGDHVRPPEVMSQETPVHKKRTLTLTLSPPDDSDEVFRLYERYQTALFNEDSTKEGFFEFLGPSSLEQSEDMGTFWWKWYIDDILVAVSVLDILPSSVVRVRGSREA